MATTPVPMGATHPCAEPDGTELGGGGGGMGDTYAWQSRVLPTMHSLRTAMMQNNVSTGKHHQIHGASGPLSDPTEPRRAYEHCLGPHF